MATKENIPTAIEQLLMSIARTNYWAVQYGPNHPATFKHIHSLHSALSACLASEPENRLLLGVARDKFYYRDRSVGKGNELIRTMTEQLYVLGVATISFGPQLSAKDLAAFFKFLYQGIDRKPDESFDQYLQRVGAAGIRINKYNFKELMSHKTGEARGIKLDAAGREDFLLRSLIFSHSRRDDETEQAIIDNIVDYPELLTAIVARANMQEDAGGSAGEDGGTAPRERSISPEVLGKLLQRLGGALKGLPEDRKKSIIAYLEIGTRKGTGKFAAAGDPPGPVHREIPHGRFLQRRIPRSPGDGPVGGGEDLQALQELLPGPRGEKKQRGIPADPLVRKDPGEPEGEGLLRPEDLGGGGEPPAFPRR